MSFNRKNWTALSSLARQWSAEDEEEQERERRRRHRLQSSTSEAKEETSSPEQNVNSQAPNRSHSSSAVKPLRLSSSKLGNERTLVEVLNKPEGKEVRRRVEIFNNVKQEKKETGNTRKLEKDVAEQKAKPPLKQPQEQKKPMVEICESLAQQTKPCEQKQHNLDKEKEKTLEKCKNSEQREKDPESKEELVFREEQKAPSVHQSQGAVVVQNEEATRESQRASGERRSISRLEVKINSRARNFTETMPVALGPQATERRSLKTDEAVTSPSGQGGTEALLLASHPVITYSSSFKRSSPRTVSFRVIPRKEKQEDTLSRSASMRLPASTVKLEEKLEKYTSAVQRAGSIKLPPSTRRNFHPLSEGVASKRSIFEATVPIRAEITPVRKESLKIPGGVTSRINLWISRTQEISKDEGTKQDIRKTENNAEWSKLETRRDDS